MLGTLRMSLFATVVATSFAQDNRATITGAVTDIRDAAVAGARVTVRSPLTGVVTAAITNDAGLYVAAHVPAGVYNVIVEKKGFRRFAHNAFSVTTGQTLELNAMLEIGEVTETVNVTAQAPVTNTRTAEISLTIESRSIEALPLTSRRTMSIIQTYGLVSFIPNDNVPTYSLAGGRVQSQMVWIDGGTGQNIRIGVGQQNVDPPVEAIHEVKILANNYAAEYGGSAGGVVIQTTRSGTNTLHGSAYEYLRNDAFDAAGFFAPAVEGIRQKPRVRYNVFGLTAGGPIRRDRTFFFTSWEGTRRVNPSTVTLTVPTDLERAGDFSLTRNAAGRVVPIYDPAGSARQPFPGNVIPAGRQDPVGANLATYFPRPNRLADNIAGTNNFRSNNFTAVNGGFVMMKVDHVIGVNDRLTARYLRYAQDTDPASVYPDRGADPITRGRSTAQYAYGSWTRVLSAGKVNDVRFTFGERSAHSTAPGVGGNYPEKVGLRGIDPLAFPLFAFPSGSYSPIGSGTQERLQSPIRQYQVVDNFTWLKGRHTLKGGWEDRFSRNQDLFLQTISGSFQFTSEASGLPGDAATGNPLASLLLGLPRSFSQTYTPALDRHSWYLSGFVQDDWRASRDLTLNVGLRWEMDTPITDSNSRMNGFDSDALNPVSGTPGVVKFAGLNGYPVHPYRFDWNNFGPRIGFAWKVAGSHSTVLRGGYGLLFAHPFDSGQTVSASQGVGVSATLNSPDNGITSPFRLRDGVPRVTPASPALDDGYGAAPAGQQSATRVDFFERHHVSGYSHQSNLTIQHEFPGLVLMELGGMANLGRKLPSANLSLNQIPPQILGPNHRSQADRPYPQFADVLLLSPSLGVTNYYAALLRVQKRLPQGFNVASTYTWSKFLGNTNDTANVAGGSLGQNNGPYSNYYNRRADYGPLESDVEHRFTFSSVWDLPFGQGRRWLQNRYAGYFAGGWTIGAFASIQSGVPLTAVTSVNNTNAFSAGRQRTNVSRNPNLPGAEQSLTRWFDTGVFSQPAAFTFGNEGVGIIRSGGWVTSDVSLLRAFRMTERVIFQLRLEAFNALNRTNLVPPAVTFGTPAFGVVSSSGPPRQLQVGARIVF
jgi:hypothetical protein